MRSGHDASIREFLERLLHALCVEIDVCQGKVPIHVESLSPHLDVLGCAVVTIEAFMQMTHIH